MWFAMVPEWCGGQLQGDVDCSHQNIELLQEKSVDEAQTSVLTQKFCERNINDKIMNRNHVLTYYKWLLK